MGLTIEKEAVEFPNEWSVLGPGLFNLLINNLRTEVARSADDTKQFKMVNTQGNNPKDFSILDGWVSKEQTTRLDVSKYKTYIEAKKILTSHIHY